MDLADGYDPTRRMAAEHSIAYGRLVGSAVLSTALVFDVLPGESDRTFAIAVVAAIWAYSLLVLTYQPYRRWPVLQAALATTLVDGLALAAFVAATGGISSPYYPIWFVAIATVAHRFGARATWLATTMYAASYVAIVAWLGQLGSGYVDLTLRLTFFLLAAGAGALISRELTDASHRVDAETRRASRAEEMAARTQGIIDAMPEAVVIADRRRHLVVANRAAVRTFALDPDHLYATSVASLFARSALPVLDGLFDGAARVTAIEVEAVRPGQGVFPAEVGVARIAGADQVILSFRDLTERRRAEEARADAAERAGEVAQLRELDRIKGEFINIAAHELGTPLTPMKVHLYLLLEHADTMPEKDRRALDVIMRNLVRLQHLRDNLLETARYQSGQIGLDLRSTDLNRLAMETVDSFAPLAEKNGVRLDVLARPGVTAEVDGRRILQVLFNVVSNAINASVEGGLVTIATEQQGDHAIVRVIDQGIGFGPDEARRLFEPFSQIHEARGPNREGPGLGLYIARGIAELHGGELAGSSPGPDRGAVFTLRLPRVASRARRVSTDRTGRPRRATRDVAGELGDDAAPRPGDDAADESGDDTPNTASGGDRRRDAASQTRGERPGGNESRASSRASASPADSRDGGDGDAGP